MVSVFPLFTSRTVDEPGSSRGFLCVWDSAKISFQNIFMTQSTLQASPVFSSTVAGCSEVAHAPKATPKMCGVSNPLETVLDKSDFSRA